MTDHNLHLMKIRQMITDNHSKARSVWNGLTTSQRAVLLHAAGIESRFLRYSWDELDNRQLLKLKRGVQRLKAIAGLFGGTGDLDFVHPVKITDVPPAPPEEIASSHIAALIEARNQLKNSTAPRGAH